MIIIVDNRQDGAKRTVKNHSITRIQAHTAYSDKKSSRGNCNGNDWRGKNTESIKLKGQHNMVEQPYHHTQKKHQKEKENADI